MDNNIYVQSSPHIRDDINTRLIMLDVIIALLPATIWGVLRFGMHSLLIIIITIATAIICESLFNLIVKKPNSISDLSCIVTGLILALNMPPEIPLFVPVVGAVFSIIIAKMIFGGLGQNFINPALAGRCFCHISFTALMNNFKSTMSVDVYTSATPLSLLKESKEINLLDLIFGYIPGTIGEVSAICLLIGAIYLLVKKVIDFKIPLFCLISFVVFILLFSNKTINMNYIMGELFGGGLLFAVFFMATDYVTAPITPLGKILYGILIGVLTGIFRLYGKTNENLSYVILILNLFVPLIDSLTIPTAFGRERK